MVDCGSLPELFDLNFILAMFDAGGSTSFQWILRLGMFECRRKYLGKRSEYFRKFNFSWVVFFSVLRMMFSYSDEAPLN